MVRITEELVRKKSEHNEGIINSLEELSLHQENVEKIEHLNNWCRNLEILLLQSNLISKIENLHKLKKLKYLNLAINNIEVVENLEKCESLEKLDLTLNFIGDLESVASLSANVYLKHLYLTGNPCTDYSGYRNYVIAKLPQIETLDSTEITRSERIKALQIINHIENNIKERQQKYTLFRKQQQNRLSHCNEDVDDETFWKSSSENAPETRIELANRARKNRNTDVQTRPETKPVKFYSKDGRPLNINQAKLPFKFNDNPKDFVLDVGVYRYLDSNLIKVDLEPNFVRITIKGKVFQFVLPDEIVMDKSQVLRSQTTGHLSITMPKLNYRPPFTEKFKGTQEIVPKEKEKRNCYLEVEPKSSLKLNDILQITEPEIPPLEYV